MIASWTFSCASCGPWDHYYEPPRPTTAPCPKCGTEAGWGRVKKNQIHRSHSGRKYGEFDPQLGCVVESYEHRRQLLKEQGLEETRPETREEIEEDTWKWNNRPQRERDPNVLVSDDLDDLRDQMFRRSDVVMRETGEGQRRRPMMESLTPFTEDTADE